VGDGVGLIVGEAVGEGEGVGEALGVAVEVGLALGLAGILGVGFGVGVEHVTVNPPGIGAIEAAVQIIVVAKNGINITDYRS
jgi:hypothetical protein